MSRANFVKLSAILALIFAAQCMSASVTYIVGKTGTSFSTISAVTCPPFLVQG